MALPSADAKAAGIHAALGAHVPPRLHVVATVPSWVYKEIFVDHVYGPISTGGDARRIVDLGANIGLASLYFALQEPDAEIVAVEANLEAFRALAANLAQIPGDRFALIDKAVSTRAGEVTFHVDHLTLGRLNASITGRNLEGKPADSIETFTVPCFDVADILQTPIDFMKVDVEGAEYEILGSPSVVPSTVREMVVEFHDMGANLDQLIPLLEMLERRGFSLIQGPDRHEIEQTPPESSECALCRFAGD